MTPDEEKAQRRLDEDRHEELVDLLKEVIGLMTIAASTVLPSQDPVDLSKRIEHVIKEAE